MKRPWMVRYPGNILKDSGAKGFVIVMGAIILLIALMTYFGNSTYIGC